MNVEHNVLVLYPQLNWYQRLINRIKIQLFFENDNMIYDIKLIYTQDKCNLLYNFNVNITISLSSSIA